MNNRSRLSIKAKNKRSPRRCSLVMTKPKATRGDVGIAPYDTARSAVAISFIISRAYRLRSPRHFVPRDDTKGSRFHSNDT